MYSCVPNNSLAYNKCHSHGLFKDTGRLLDALLNKFIKSLPNKQCFRRVDPFIRYTRVHIR